MKFVNLYTAVLLILTCGLCFTSCDDESFEDLELTPIFDCSELELNFRDTCLNNSLFGIVDSNCICTVTQDSIVDCPNLGLFIGDRCTLDPTVNDTLFGVVSMECECTLIPDEFDCPDIMLNFKDTCFVGNQYGIVDQLCECIVNDTIVDCPSLGLNFGAPCVDTLANVFNGIVTDNCECLESAVEFDCPQLMLNVSDTCIVDFDCPQLMLNVADTCIVNNMLGIVTEECLCE